MFYEVTFYCICNQLFTKQEGTSGWEIKGIDFARVLVAIGKVLHQKVFL